MTQKDKELLRKDLCARLAYGVMCKTNNSDKPQRLKGIIKHHKLWWFEFDGFRGLECKPYLRPMSSMTDKELATFLEIRGMNLNSEELQSFREGQTAIVSTLPSYSRHVDWLNAHHFDYRGLIPKGLAIEVTEENNPYK